MFISGHAYNSINQSINKGLLNKAGGKDNYMIDLCTTLTEAQNRISGKDPVFHQSQKTNKRQKQSKIYMDKITALIESSICWH